MNIKFAWSLAALAFYAFAFIVAARAHSPTPAATWKYDAACCSGFDCKPMTYAPARVIGGYMMRDGAVYPTKDHYQSGDMLFHRCPKCLYVPGGT